MPAELVLTPVSFDFEAVTVGATASHTFQLENVGQVGSGTPDIRVSGATDDNFHVIANGCQTSLDPLGTCTIEVEFAPSATGDQGALLEAEASPGGRVSSQLEGTGAPP